MWRNPELSSFLSKLAKHVRVILFDKRGTGLSDRVTELSTLEERMDDIRAVMDAVESEKAILFGHSEGGSVSALFAATYPHRTVSLITFGVFAKRRRSEEYPWAPSDDAREKVYDMIESSWGTNRMDLASLAPSMAGNTVFMDWLANYFRSGASPSAALVLTKMNTDVDIIDILDTITVPTLLLYRTDDIDVSIEEGRFITERIKGSKFIEFPGNDHLFWVGDADVVRREMVRFISRSGDRQVYDRVLATILKIAVHKPSQIGGTYKAIISDQLGDKVEQIIHDHVNQYRGVYAGAQGESRTATFDGPSKAVHCAMEIKTSIGQLELTVCQGVHIGECVRNEQDGLGGRAVSVADELLSSGSEGDILITQTVQNLLSGAGLEFRHHGYAPGFDHRRIEILALHEGVDSLDPLEDALMTDLIKGSSAKNYSLLENVIQSIEDHLGDEDYDIQALCREVGVSQRHLQRKLKSITNKSPNQLIRSVRLHRAKEMILSRKKSISEAAYLTGFNGVSYFTKCFKKEFGQKPSEL